MKLHPSDGDYYTDEVQRNEERNYFYENSAAEEKENCKTFAPGQQCFKLNS